MSNRRRNADSTIMPFHTLQSAALVSGAASITANPLGLSNSGRLLTEADAWAHFRIRKLSLRLHPQTGMAGQFQVLGFVGGNQDSTPATAGTVAELIPSAVLAQDSTVPTEWIKVPKQDLAGPFPWYKSVAGNADATEESPGQICIGGTGTDVYILEMRGIVEFKTAVSTTNTPAEVALRARLRSERVAHEREVAQKRVLALLGCQPVFQPVSTGGLPSSVKS